jgi:Tol biopolymer transport system component
VSHPWIATIDPETGHAVSMDRLTLPDEFGGTVLAAWSPVADELAVIERIAGQEYAIWRMRPDGAGARRIVEYGASTYGGVDWTPDATRLVYGGFIDGRMQLFSVGSDGGEPVQLTAESEDVLQPQVSPNGEWIAASRLRHVKELRRMPVG